MLALIAAVIAGIASVETHLGEVALLPVAVALLAAHHALGEWAPWRRP